MDLTALRGKHLLVPVTAQRRHLALRLAEAGAIVEEVDFIAIAPTEDLEALEEATLSWCAGDFDWMAVTSRNALAAMERIARARGVSLSAPLPDAQVATVGEATRGVCEEMGLEVAMVPQGRQNARGIVEEFPDGPGKVLVPHGNLAAPVLPRGLERKGWSVTTVEAYRTVDGSGVGRQLREEIEDGRFDAILLTSGSVAERLAASGALVPEETAVVAIGDMTAAAARAAAVPVTSVATAPSYDGIVAGLLAALDPDVVEEFDALDEDAADDEDTADAPAEEFGEPSVESSDETSAPNADSAEPAESEAADDAPEPVAEPAPEDERS
ncbi:uroporphyrinogen-III synthase [Demequina activiva]|uniref:Uroporphyrinogen-III synthase n=1 Tax=Demequina activiva TaxID=1582364 RepID=A0A919Q2H5_9MICO|nr:uroporphyrinogen-III synthase [Demequina activiva]GIG55065.1 hypothetical protein Dac01nite_18170 [Demequina activiva]